MPLSTMSFRGRFRILPLADWARCKILKEQIHGFQRIRRVKIDDVGLHFPNLTLRSRLFTESEQGIIGNGGT